MWGFSKPQYIDYVQVKSWFCNILTLKDIFPPRHCPTLNQKPASNKDELLVSVATTQSLEFKTWFCCNPETTYSALVRLSKSP